MNQLRHQQTISKVASLDGFGYWSGKDITVTFRPADANTGIVFVREDLPDHPRIPVHVKHRIEIPRRTSLKFGKATVEMVEHILAALAGLQIDNCEVWVTGIEMPGGDGSSLPFVEVLQQAGISQQSAFKNKLIVREIARVGDENLWVEAHPPLENSSLKKGSHQIGFSLEFRINYSDHPAIGKQKVKQSVTVDSFVKELAPCRTFILKSEADWLQSQGLAMRPTTSDLLIFTDQGPIDNPLRFPNECVRHKALDLVGDLSLTGCDLVGHFIAHCSGHRLNAEMATVLLREAQLMSDHSSSKRISA